MTDRPSDRAIAQAFWETDSLDGDGSYRFEEKVIARAREIDAAAPKIDPDKYPSTRPADQLPADVLIEVALQSAGRAALYDNATQHSRLQECRAELLRRLAAAPEGAQAVACHRTVTENGAKWAWIDGPPSLGAMDNLKVHPNWRIECAYTAPPSLDAEDAAELERLRTLVNSPELHDFAKGVVLEAAHQRERWGSSHDAGKEPADWFWLLGYLSGKALRAHIDGNADKALHHTISSAAALANWHGAIMGTHNMRPGIDSDAARAAEGKGS